MNTLSKQRGLSMLSILTILFVASFFLTCGVKLVPLYLDAWTIDKAIKKGVETGEFKALSASQITRKLTSTFDMNRVEAIKINDIKVKRLKNGEMSIDASYEKRVPLIQNIDVVVKFDYLKYQFVSNPED